MMLEFTEIHDEVGVEYVSASGYVAKDFEDVLHLYQMFGELLDEYRLACHGNIQSRSTTVQTDVEMLDRYVYRSRYEI